MKHTVKKLSSLFLALSLAAGLCLTPALAAKTNYPDAQASWAASSIERWSGSGIVKGDGNGNFNPDAPLSRAELAQIFVNMFGLTEKADNMFGDLKGDEWYADAILKCAAAGIMKGDGSRVNAGANISRAETIVMFGRAVGVTPDETPDLSKFSDGADVADWAAGYLAPFTKMGILSGGGDGTLNADGQIDRASTMALLDKSVAEYVNAPGEYKVDNANGFVIVNLSAKEGEVVISGAAAGVVVSDGTAEGKIVAKDLKADTIKVDGSAKVSVEGKSAVGEIVANAEGTVSIAKGVTVDTVTANSTGTVTNAGTVNSLVANGAATVSNTGTVKELVANAPAKVDNKGTITKAEVKADGVVLDGKKPTTVAVDEGTKNPTNSDGKEIKPGTDKPSGGGSYDPGPSVSDTLKSKVNSTMTALNSWLTTNAGGLAKVVSTGDTHNIVFNVDNLHADSTVGGLDGLLTQIGQYITENFPSASLTVNGEKVYDSGIQNTALKNLLFDTAHGFFYDFANMAEGQFRAFSATVAQTGGSYGFTVNVKFEGAQLAEFQDVMAVVADHIAFEVVGGNAVVTVNMPEKLMAVLKAMAGPDATDAEIKAAFDRQTVGECFAALAALSPEDLLGSHSEYIEKVAALINANASLINKALGKVTSATVDGTDLLAKNAQFTPTTGSTDWAKLINGVSGVLSDTIKGTTTGEYYDANGVYEVPVNFSMSMDGMGLSFTETVIIRLNIFNGFVDADPSTT